MNVFFRFLALSAVGMVLSSGCASGPKPHTIKIVPMTAFAVPVDLVGVNDVQLRDLMAYDVDKYWSPDDPVRNACKKAEFQVSGGKVTPSDMLLMDASIWAKWHGKGVTHVVAIADLRGDFKNVPGPLDPRRADIDLLKRFAGKAVVVEIHDKVIEIATPFK